MARTKRPPAYLALLPALLAASVFSTATLAQSNWNYGKRGWEWSEADTGSYLWAGLRFQTRYNTHLDDIRDLSQFDDEENSGLRINRSRYKIGAGYRDSLSFYHEYDLRNSRLLDLRASWAITGDLNLRIGQWKSEFNRERVDSSGKQQFVERSIATYWFTVDRQWGAMASGKLWQDTPSDTNWWAGILGGVGRGNSGDGGRPMLVGRWQWNYTGNTLPFSQSALKRYQQPHASLAVGAVANDSRYTRFSSNGGGQLPGFEEGKDNQYRIYQLMQEWAWHKGGLSFQQELHWKSIEDRKRGGTRSIFGGYAQAGWFPAERWTSMPQNLEFAARAAYVDPDSGNEQHNEEYTLAANLFLSGHRNKFTFDISYFSVDEEQGHGSDIRYRLQWDLSY
jgi:phosphate-selective porin OprO and OprP